MTTPPSDLQGDQDYRKQWNVTVAEIDVKKSEIKKIAEEEEVPDVDEFELLLETATSLTKRQELAKKKFARLQKLEAEKIRYIGLLEKSSEVYLLLFLCNAFRRKPV